MPTPDTDASITGASIAIGTPVPDFRAPSSNGQTLDRDSFLGKVPVVLLFPPADLERDPVLREFDDRLVEFGHRRVQVLVVAHAAARAVRELADRIPLHGLTVLADQDGSIAQAYAPAEGRCYMADASGLLRAVVPYGPGAVDDVLRVTDLFVPTVDVTAG